MLTQVGCPLAGNYKVRPDGREARHQYQLRVSIPLRGIIRCDAVCNAVANLNNNSFHPLAGNYKVRHDEPKPVAVCYTVSIPLRGIIRCDSNTSIASLRAPMSFHPLAGNCKVRQTNTTKCATQYYSFHPLAGNCKVRLVVLRK